MRTGNIGSPWQEKSILLCTPSKHSLQSSKITLKISVPCSTHPVYSLLSSVGRTYMMGQSCPWLCDVILNKYQLTARNSLAGLEGRNCHVMRATWKRRVGGLQMLRMVPVYRQQESGNLSPTTARNRILPTTSEFRRGPKWDQTQTDTLISAW